MPFSTLARRFGFASILPVLIVFMLSACGRKGSPRPPEETAPTAVVYLSARGEPDAVILSWQAPNETTAGESLRDLARFIVRRTEVAEGRTGSPIDIGVVRAEDAKSISPTPGGKPRKQYSFRDTAVQAGRRYEYVVLAENEDGVEGLNDVILRVSFAGESSTVETITAEADK